MEAEQEARQYLPFFYFELQTSLNMWSFTAFSFLSLSLSLCFWSICIVFMVTLHAQFCPEARKFRAHIFVFMVILNMDQLSWIFFSLLPFWVSLFLWIKNPFWYQRSRFLAFWDCGLNWVFILSINKNRRTKEEGVFGNLMRGQSRRRKHMHLWRLGHGSRRRTTWCSCRLSLLLLPRWIPWDIFRWNGRSF